MYLLYGRGDMLQDLAAILGVPCQEGRGNVSELILRAEAVCAGIVGPALRLALSSGQGQVQLPGSVNSTVPGDKLPGGMPTEFESGMTWRVQSAGTWHLMTEGGTSAGRFCTYTPA